jgi:hypothetical protein
MGKGALSPGLKRPRHEAEHSHLVLRSRTYGSIHPLPHMSSWRSALLVTQRDNFTFFFYSVSTINIIYHWMINGDIITVIWEWCGTKQPLPSILPYSFIILYICPAYYLSSPLPSPLFIMPKSSCKYNSKHSVTGQKHQKISALLPTTLFQCFLQGPCPLWVQAKIHTLAVFCNNRSENMYMC